ncbi:MAG: transcriptional repressor NrdR [Verrucomicrobiaceae bacterium]|nr:transcriptional repressor NrdR [Verrucomicrobiaceae bacterium]
MQCIKCGNLKDKVVDSREAKGALAIRRRRECLNCGYRFTTYEQLERSDIHVVKRNGARESLKRNKLLDGLVKACEKRPVSIEVLESAADEIISEIQIEGIREVPTQTIGARVMKSLETIDPVAYVRYASVYRQFQEVGEFIEEIQSLESRPSTGARHPDFFSQ